MKMLFSINKKQPLNNKKENKEKTEEKKEYLNRNPYLFPIGMFSIIKNSSNCSNCGK
jgi:hypothetical protein